MQLSTKLSLAFLPAVAAVALGLLLVAADILDVALLESRQGHLLHLLEEMRQEELLAELGAETGVPLGPEAEAALLAAWRKAADQAARHLVVLQSDGTVIMSTQPGAGDYADLWREELADRLPSDAPIAGIVPLPGEAVPYAAGRYGPLGWVLVVAMPPDVVEATLQELDWWILGVMAVLSILLLLLGWLLARRMLLRPVALLHAAARDIAALRPVLRIPVHGGDELAGLARSLEQAARGLAEAFGAVRRERDMNAVLMDSAPAAFAVLDGQRRILRVNPRFAQLVGGQVVGRSLAETVAGAADRAAAERHFAGTGGVAEFRLPEAPGGEAGAEGRVLAWTLAALPRDRSGAGEGGGKAAEAPDGPASDGPAYVAIGIDVSERHRAEAEQRALQAQAEHRQRLETLGTFAGGVAHDLNNILTPVVGYSRMAEERAGGDPVLADYLSRVRKAADRARYVIRQILTFGRKVGPEKEVLDLAELAGDCLDLELPESETGIAVVRDWPAGPGPLVEADPVQLHQVLANLVSNARHAMPGGGRLQVSVGVARRAPGAGMAGTVRGGEGTAGEQAAREQAAGDEREWAVLSVADTGSGMDEAVLARIFEPFFTTKQAGRGTGLGLAVAHGIVGAHGGWIEAQSRPGEGSRFTIYLPLAPAQAAGAIPAAGPPAPDRPVPPGSRVLVVDDEAELRLLAERLLAQAGCRVATAEDGPAALARLRPPPEGEGLEVDLVLTDLAMPGMSGIELAAAIAALRPGLPLLAMTGGPGAGSGGAAGGAGSLGGFAGLLPKPFTPEDLLAAVGRALAGAAKRP